MRTRTPKSLFPMIFTLLTISSIATPQPLIREVDTLTQEERSLATFQFLNDISIRFERAKTNAFNLIEREEYTQAKTVCEQFMKELKECISTLNLQAGLTDSDRRFVHQELRRVQKATEQIIENMPPGI